MYRVHDFEAKFKVGTEDLTVEFQVSNLVFRDGDKERTNRSIAHLI